MLCIDSADIDRFWVKMNTQVLHIRREEYSPVVIWQRLRQTSGRLSAPIGISRPDILVTGAEPVQVQDLGVHAATAGYVLRAG